MILADASIFIGRFHPLLVHLPIGFLLLAAVLALASSRKQYHGIQPAISLTLLAGTVSAFLACITGFELSSGGDYDQEVLNIHKLGGFATFGISFIAYLLSRKLINLRFLKSSRSLLVTLLAMVAVISITGHLGGTLTHGAGYLSPDVFFAVQKKQQQITDINEAVVYEDLVQPILEKKCRGCHNSSKKKGEFSMQTFTSLMKGGKHGAVIDPGNTSKSELVKRINLDPKDEKFMPSDNKPALNETEKNILVWWIDSTGATTGKKFKDTRATAAIRKEAMTYLGLQGGEPDKMDTDSSNIYYTDLNTGKVSDQQVSGIKQLGFTVKYVNINPVLLDITLLPEKEITPDRLHKKLEALLSISDNIVWLNLSGNNISDANLETIGHLKNLQRLKLDNNPITDKGVAMLKNLSRLESLNLYNTGLSNQSVGALSLLPKLTHVYVWGTSVVKQDSSSRIHFVTGVN
jgi:uncharacterized membrane protein